MRAPDIPGAESERGLIGIRLQQTVNGVPSCIRNGARHCVAGRRVVALCRVEHEEDRIQPADARLRQIELAGGEM